MFVVGRRKLRCSQVVIIRVVNTERLGLVLLLAHPLRVNLFRVSHALELICRCRRCDHTLWFRLRLLLDWNHLLYEKLLEVVVVRFLDR